MIKLDASVILDTAHIRQTWCVYEHQATLTAGEPPETILIGACRLIDLFMMMDARANSEWQKMYSDGGQVLVRIVAVTLDRSEAFRHAGDLIKSASPKPRCNALGYNMRGTRRPIMCVQNGKRYETQLAAAEDLGIYSSTISRQLRGKTDKAQGGFQFVYVSDVV